MVKKDILYITFMQNYFNTLVQRTHHIIDNMEKREDINKIDVIIIDNSQEEKIRKLEVKGKVTYYSVKITPSWIFGLGHISNPLKMFFRIKKFNKDQYSYIIAETPWGGLVGTLLKLIGRTNKLIYEDMDYFIGFYTKSKVRRILVNLLENIVMKSSNLIVTIGDELEKVRQKQTKKKIIVIPNGVNTESFNAAISKSEHVPTLVYMGKMDDWAGIDLVIKSLPIIKKNIDNIKFIIIGEGNYEEQLKSLVEECNLSSNVEFVGLKKYTELVEYLKIADIGVATFKKIDLMKYACTLKILEYGAGGLPVIATAIGETENYIEKNKCGIAIKYDEKEFAQAVLNLFNNTVLYKRLSENGIEASYKMQWDELLEDRYNKINNFLDNK